MKPQATITFGPDYPKTLTDLLDNVEMPLVKESAWSRVFRHPSTGAVFMIPRTMDGSASLTLAQLQSKWPDWTSKERLDCAHGVAWLREQADFPDILRFLMRNGAPAVWTTIALSVAKGLPQDEAYQLLVNALEATDLRNGANLHQAIAETGHASAVTTIRRHLDRICSAPGLWDDGLENALAMEAMWATKHLLDLDENPNEFVELVRKLADHRCARVRRFVRMHLKSTYPWLSEE